MQNWIKELSLTEHSQRVCSIRDNSLLPENIKFCAQMCYPYYNTQVFLVECLLFCVINRSFYVLIVPHLSRRISRTIPVICCKMFTTISDNLETFAPIAVYIVIEYYNFQSILYGFIAFVLNIASIIIWYPRTCAPHSSACLQYWQLPLVTEFVFAPTILSNEQIERIDDIPVWVPYEITLICL